MNTTTVTENSTGESQRRGLSTADIAAASHRPAEERAREERNRSAANAEGIAASMDGNKSTDGENDELAPLFSADLAKEFRVRWDAVQSGFVDDPKQAVRRGDELVAEVMKSLADSFSKERTQLEGQLDHTDAASTENLRIALRRYRSFFKRLLSL